MNMVNVTTSKSKKVCGVTFEMSRDMNGNKTVKIVVPWGKSFSIQTNGNLPRTHRTNEPCYSEIKNHVEDYGTNYQKSVF